MSAYVDMGSAPSKPTPEAGSHDSEKALLKSLADVRISAPLSQDGALQVGHIDHWESAVAQSPKLQLSLSKGVRFTVTVDWRCDADHADDVDIHALEARNDGQGAKVTALEQVLSTYNTRKMSRSGVLPVNPDGSFSTAS